MDQRGAATDQLTDVIRIAQLVRKSGILLVERDGVNGTLEEGKITFVDGRVTEATAGQMRGQAAYNWLNSWGTCRFVFMPFSSPSTTMEQNIPTAPNGLMHSTDHLTSPTSSGAAPSRIRDADEVLPLFGAMGLSRAHRQLFLLIDGQRTVPDLARLCAHGTDDVYRMLADLERMGLIQ